MLKPILKGLKGVLTLEGLGTLAGVYLAFVLLAYFGQSPDHTAAVIRTKTGG